jgi:hypothetical protein
MISMKSYEMFDSFLEQFIIAKGERGKGLSREYLNIFFQLCRKYYSTIEHNVKQDVPALKSLIRMIALLPINKENMLIGSEAARQFASIVLKTLSERLPAVWTTIVDTEWPSFCEGLVTLCCFKILHNQESEKETNDSFDLISMIPDEVRRQETAMKLLNLLGDLQCILSRKQEVTLYTLVGQDHLTLEHLELAASLETYISYLTQLVIAHQGEDNQLEEKIQIQLSKLFRENRLRSKK